MTQTIYLVLIGICIGIASTPFLYWIVKSVKRLPNDFKEYALTVITALRG